MVSHVIQLFPSISHTTPDLGCIDDLRRWPCHVTCHGTCSAEWIVWYSFLASNGVDIDRLKNADFEKAMNLITTRIDVKDDDKLMHLVFKEAVKNGALKFDFKFLDTLIV